MSRKRAVVHTASCCNALTHKALSTNFAAQKTSGLAFTQSFTASFDLTIFFLEVMYFAGKKPQKKNAASSLNPHI